MGNPAWAREAPLIGQDNEYVCTKVLDIVDEEFVELLNEGVLE